MAKTVTVRDLEIGVGTPKIIVPIVGKTQQEVLWKAAAFQGLKMDVVEWRVDFCEDVFDTPRMLETLAKLREALGNLPLLFTFRTQKEGGEKDISMEAYTSLNKAVAESGHADLIDVEIFSGDDVVAENIRNIHGAGKLVVGSNHDFHATPPKDEIVARLQKMQELGADIPKIALMPTCTADVLTLLAATNEMKERYADRPVITMSMGATGVISRLCGEVFGSAMTFGAVGQVSAPGQIPVKALAEVLEILHNAI